MIADLLTKEALAEGSVKPQGNRSERDAPWGVYPCAGEEQWCVITVTGDADWRALRAAMGEPDWAADRGLDTAPGRLARQAELDERLAAWTRTRDARQLTQTLQSRGVPAGFMMYSSAVADDPHLRARADTCGICRDVLGMGDDEIRELLRSGAIEVDAAVLNVE
jgi:crotonobetainyl-CoA:carnitine CoA-transferase CaiB-like acyl-CoA transferase